MGELLWKYTYTLKSNMLFWFALKTRNWKKGKERFKEHELSQTHNEAVLKYESLSRPSVVVL